MKKNIYDIQYKNESVHWWSCGRQKIVFPVLDNFITDIREKNILDAGCGVGTTLDFLKKKGCKNIYGIDISEKAVNYCREKNLNVVAGTIQDLPFDDNFFDIVLAMDVIEHAENDQAALRELARVLKPKGIMLITVPAYQFLWSSHDVICEHIRRYTRRELDKLVLGNDFTILKSSYFNIFLFPFTFIRKFLKERQSELLIQAPPSAINKSLMKIFSSELFFLKRINLPFGVSILNLAIKN